jgi:hypothetical protein
MFLTLLVKQPERCACDDWIHYAHAVGKADDAFLDNLTKLLKIN